MLSASAHRLLKLRCVIIIIHYYSVSFPVLSIFQSFLSTEVKLKIKPLISNVEKVSVTFSYTNL